MASKKILTRGEAVAKTWKNPEIAAARATHTPVRVAGKEYRSVPTAFKELGLPLGRMCRFRLVVKAEGRATFEHEGKKYNFVALAAE